VRKYGLRQQKIEFRTEPDEGEVRYFLKDRVFPQQSLGFQFVPTRIQQGLIAVHAVVVTIRWLGARLGISIQVTSMDDQSVQVTSIRPQCLFAPIPAA